MSKKLSDNNTEYDSISLSELSRKIKKSLKQSFPEKFWVVGEISEFRVNTNGHVYLELVEKKANSDNISARIKATIWSFTYRMLRPYFEGSTGYMLSSGIKIMVLASLEYHPLYSLSLNITDIDPAYTLGDLAKKKEETIQKLLNEGVLEMNKEISLPQVPQRIAVISSDTAAGYEDFLNSLENNSNNFHFQIHLFPAIMQGEKAAKSIISMLDKIFENEENYDLVVIVRGGGAKLDLECFNDYELALNIAQFPLPVLTGIGHERDDTIADLVAHTRLKTPTAIAEFLIDQMNYFSEKIEKYSLFINNHINTLFHNELNIISQYSIILNNYFKDILLSESQKLNTFKIKIENRSSRHLLIQQNEINAYQEKIKNIFNHHFQQEKIRQTQLSDKIQKNLPRIFNTEKEKLKSYYSVLSILDPINIQKRGYSIVFKDGVLIKDVSQLKSGDEIITKLYKGKIKSKLIQKLK